ncbi:MAG: HU family DNA-binding protein [Isosphaeraceae bacterium]
MTTNGRLLREGPEAVKAPSAWPTKRATGVLPAPSLSSKLTPIIVSVCAGEFMGTTRDCLTRADLAAAIYVALPVDKPKAAQIVEDYIELIKEALEKEGKVVLAGFGAYEVKFKAPRPGRNPHTGDSLILRARKVVKFKISKPFRKTMNGQQVTAEDEADEDGDNSDIDTPAKR